MASTLTFETMPIGKLKANPRNARTHSKKQIKQIADEYFRVRLHQSGVGRSGRKADCRSRPAGSGSRTWACPALPTIVIAGLSESEKRKLMLADNKIALNAGWDSELLAIELNELLLIDDFDPETIGFSTAEIDKIIIDHEDSSADPADPLPAIKSNDNNQQPAICGFSASTSCFAAMPEVVKT